MKLSPDIKNSILELTKRFHKIQNDNPPYLVNSFLEYTNIIEVQAAEIDFDGYTIPVDEDKYVIGYNHNHHDHRRRFTCCHELAHTLLFEEDLRRDYKMCLINVWNRTNDEESLCNRIAAELLLPTNVFTEFASKFKPSMSSLLELGKDFRVSCEVVIRRILELDLWDINIASWKPIDPDWPYGSYRLTNIFSCGKMDYLLRKGYILDMEPPAGLHSSYINGTQNEDHFKGNIVMDSMRRRCNNNTSVLSMLRKL